MSQQAERRSHPRTDFRAWVEIATDGGRSLGKGRDLSRGGLCVATERAELQEANLVEAEFQLPGIHLPLILLSRVAWTDEGAGLAGLRFVDVDPGLGELIDNFVAGRL